MRLFRSVERPWLIVKVFWRGKYLVLDMYQKKLQTWARNAPQDFEKNIRVSVRSSLEVLAGLWAISP
jgi:hypothetical protein